MKINTTAGAILGIILLFLGCVSCGPTSGGSHIYSPLYKYRAYPMTNVHNNPAIAIQDIQILTLHDGYQTLLAAKNGIISNTVYPEIGQGLVVMHSNGTSLTNFILTNVPYDRIVTANNKYIALLVSNTLMVLDTNLSNRFSLPINTNLFIAALGNGDSPLLAYGELTELRGTNFTTITSNFPAGHYLRIRNLESQSTLQLTDAYGIAGFSRRNKYLFFTYYTDGWYHYNADGQEIYPSGPLMAYDISGNSLITIADYSYETSTNGWAVCWTDTINGIRSDLKGFYVTELASGTVFSSGPLDDGRSCWDEAGLWYVDISSLGLSE